MGELEKNKKNAKLLFAQPIDKYFIWQCQLYIESCIEAGFDQSQIHVLLYKPLDRIPDAGWMKLNELYPEINIFIYEDKGIDHLLPLYIPILRPHILKQHFEKYPELEKETIIYTDCDILWLNSINIDHLIGDDINYMSDASSYMNYNYFCYKAREVLPEKKEEFDKRDIIQELCDIVGVHKSLLIENNNNTGGVQYILKNIDYKFWEKVEKDVISIRKHLLQVNRDFFASENAGYQSWCADLFAVQWNLWALGRSTKTVRELDFAWSTDPIEKINTYPILHNAGISGDFQNGFPALYKGKYVSGSNPINDEHLYTIIDSPESRKYCTHYYTRKLLELKQKYKPLF